ncbi:TPA: acyltransferase family protein [Escherichia coli]
MAYKIQSIQALRGIAAMLVVLGHMNVYLNDVYVQKNLGDLLFYNGVIGVDIFFVISGFIIALATEKKRVLYAPNLSLSDSLGYILFIY